jgi:predicted alpha/beta superfamily hydrolase
MNEQAKRDIPVKTRLATFDLGQHRIDVASPLNVTAETPILVMHDGGNLLLPRTETWNNQNWSVIESLEAGLVTNTLMPVVVGVHTGQGSSRYNELSPASILAKDPNAFDSLPAEVLPADLTCRSEEYQAFLAHKVLPKVAAELGIKLDPSRTAIGGSSMGGLASIYGLGLYPEIYGTALSFSTHWPFGREVAVETLIDALPNPAAGLLHYAAIDRLEARGWRRDTDFEARLYAGTGHQEKYWAARWPDAVNWWLSATPRL